MTEWDFPSARQSPDGTYAVVVGFSEKSETRLWEGITYEAITKLMRGRRQQRCRLVDALLARRLRLAVDDRIEAEYREVLARPRLGIDPIRREPFLAILQFQEHVTAAAWAHRIPPDRDDVIFLEVAVQTSARIVVTGNLKHFPRRGRGPVTVLPPRPAWNRFVALG